MHFMQDYSHRLLVKEGDEVPGHLEKRSKNSWTIVIGIGRAPTTGKRKRIYRAFQGTKREAEKEMARLIAEIEKGTYVEPAKLTFGEYLQRWLNDYKVRLSPTTQRRYQQILNLRVIPQLGMIPLQKLKPIHIKEFYRNLIEKGRIKIPRYLRQVLLIITGYCIRPCNVPLRMNFLLNILDIS